MIGEWVALPIWYTAGGKAVGDALYEEILHPTAGRLIERCDAILRLRGESKGADNDIRLAKSAVFPSIITLMKSLFINNNQGNELNSYHNLNLTYYNKFQ